MDEFLNILAHEFELPLSNPVLVFTVILFIILFSPLLFKKLNIPGIIVLIISGVIIGPYGLGILENNAAVELFSTIGLIYIMFIAGLELDMNQFKINRYKSVLFGFFTFIVPLAIGFPVVHYLLGYDFNSSFLTASMFATHTLLAYPIISKLGVSKNEAVAITVGGTILTDTAVLIILAVILGNSQEGGLSMDFWIRLVVSLTIFSAIIFTVVPRVAKWFFRTLENEKHSHYIFVLAVVFFSSFLAELAGVEHIIGAFLAGLALNPLIPHSSALMNRIEFLGNSLFIPFFLLSVGMLVDVGVILEGPRALIVAGTLSVVAILGKWIAAYLTQKSLKYSKVQRQTIFGLSSGHAAATLAVIIVGYDAGVIDDNILNGTIILILVTSMVSTFATEKAARKLVGLEEEDEVNNSNGMLNNEHILLPIANIVNFDKLLEFAILIKQKKSENPIYILSVVPNNEEAELNIAKAKSKLEVFVKQASAVEADVKIIASIDHNIASGIARASREVVADIIVMGWPSNSSILDRVIGSKMKKIIKTANKTTFICHINHPWGNHKRLFLAVPDNVEKMDGFHQWMHKAERLSQELSIPILVHCSEKTQTHMREVSDELNLKAPFSYQTFTDWDDFLILSKEVRDDDILMLVSARQENFSYQSVLENLPNKLGKHFSNNSKILVYPR